MASDVCASCKAKTFIHPSFHHYPVAGELELITAFTGQESGGFLDRLPVYDRTNMHKLNGGRPHGHGRGRKLHMERLQSSSVTLLPSGDDANPEVLSDPKFGIKVGACLRDHA